MACRQIVASDLPQGRQRRNGDRPYLLTTRRCRQKRFLATCQQDANILLASCWRRDGDQKAGVGTTPGSAAALPEKIDLASQQVLRRCRSEAPSEKGKTGQRALARRLRGPALLEKIDSAAGRSRRAIDYRYDNLFLSHASSHHRPARSAAARPNVGAAPLVSSKGTIKAVSVVEDRGDMGETLEGRPCSKDGITLKTCFWETLLG
jgi:hypothetical protein